MTSDLPRSVDLVVILTAKDRSSMDELRELLREQASRSRAEPGCERFEVYEGTEGSGTFVLVERWESMAALETHRSGEACQMLYIPRVLPLVDRVPHLLSRVDG